MPISMDVVGSNLVCLVRDVVGSNLVCLVRDGWGLTLSVWLGMGGV